MYKIWPRPQRHPKRVSEGIPSSLVYLRVSTLTAEDKKMLTQHSDYRIQKRALLHPAIPSPYTGAQQPKVVYISTKTPFMSAVKRIRKLLALIEKRTFGKVDLIKGVGTDKQKLNALSKKDKEPEEVILKATNRAIPKAICLAQFFQGQDDCKVQLRTGSVGTVDDIVEMTTATTERLKAGTLESTKTADENAPEFAAVELDDGKEDGKKGEMDKEKEEKKKRDEMEKEKEVEKEDKEEEEEEQDVPESQIRFMSVLEVYISLR